MKAKILSFDMSPSGRIYDRKVIEEFISKNKQLLITSYGDLEHPSTNETIGFAENFKINGDYLEADCFLTDTRFGTVFSSGYCNIVPCIKVLKEEKNKENNEKVVKNILKQWDNLLEKK